MAGIPYSGPGWQKAAATLQEGSFRLWFQVKANDAVVAISNITTSPGACAPDGKDAYQAWVQQLNRNTVGKHYNNRIVCQIALSLTVL